MQHYPHQGERMSIGEMMREAMRIIIDKKMEIFSDLLFLIGCALIIFGAYLLNPIAAIITGGFIFIALGTLVGMQS